MLSFSPFSFDIFGGIPVPVYFLLFYDTILPIFTCLRLFLSITSGFVIGAPSPWTDFWMEISERYDNFTTCVLYRSWSAVEGLGRETLARVAGRLGAVVVSSSALFPSHDMRMWTKRLRKNVFEKHLQYPDTEEFIHESLLNGFDASPYFLFFSHFVPCFSIYTRWRIFRFSWSLSSHVFLKDIPYH